MAFMSFRRKLTAVLVYLLLVLCVTVLVVITDIRELSRSQVQILQFSQKTDQVDQLTQKLRQMVSIYRLGVNLPEARHLMESSRQDVTLSFKQTDVTKFSKPFRRIVENLQRNFVELEGFGEDLNESIKRDIDLAYHDQETVKAKISKISEWIMTGIAEMQQELAVERLEIVTELESIQSQLIQKLIFLAVGAFLLTFAGMIYLSRSLSGLMIGVRRMIRDLLQGEFKLQNYRRKGELTVLSRDLQELDSRLIKAREQVLKGRDAHFELFFRKKLSDLNNALTAIATITEVYRDNTDKMRTALISDVSEATQRAADISKLLGMYSQSDSGFELNANVEHLIRECIDMIRHAVTPGITFRSECASDLYAVSADRMQIFKVLLDVSINACEAYKGKGEVLFRAKNVIVDEASELKSIVSFGDYVWIVVMDQAGGIAKEDLLKIFDPFYSTKEETEHSGLGLTKCLEIVRGFGGNIQITSDKKSGTSIHIFLPKVSQQLEVVPEIEVAKLNVATELNGQDEEKEFAGSKNVLILYPEKTTARSLEQYATRIGANVFYAGTVEEGLDTFERNLDTIDTVIMDWNLPDMDAFDVCVRMMDQKPGIQIRIASESYDRDEIQDVFRNSANVSYIERPVNRQELQAMFSA